jgi:hypothetical protein
MNADLAARVRDAYGRVRAEYETEVATMATKEAVATAVLTVYEDTDATPERVEHVVSWIEAAWSVAWGTVAFEGRVVQALVIVFTVPDASRAYTLEGFLPVTFLDKLDSDRAREAAFLQGTRALLNRAEPLVKKAAWHATLEAMVSGAGWKLPAFRVAMDVSSTWWVRDAAWALLKEMFRVTWAARPEAPHAR